MRDAIGVNNNKTLHNNFFFLYISLSLTHSTYVYGWRRAGEGYEVCVCEYHH